LKISQICPSIFFYTAISAEKGNPSFVDPRCITGETSETSPWVLLIEQQIDGG
jgi:hypothetical protein